MCFTNKCKKKIKTYCKTCTSTHQNRWCFFFLGRFLGFLKHPLRRKQEKAQCWDLKIWGIKDMPPTSTCWGSATGCWDIHSRTTGKTRSDGNLHFYFCLTFKERVWFFGYCSKHVKQEREILLCNEMFCIVNTQMWSRGIFELMYVLELEAFFRQQLESLKEGVWVPLCARH